MPNENDGIGMLILNPMLGSVSDGSDGIGIPGSPKLKLGIGMLILNPMLGSDRLGSVGIGMPGSPNEKDGIGKLQLLTGQPQILTCLVLRQETRQFRRHLRATVAVVFRCLPCRQAVPSS